MTRAVNRPSNSFWFQYIIQFVQQFCHKLALISLKESCCLERPLYVFWVPRCKYSIIKKYNTYNKSSMYNTIAYPLTLDILFSSNRNIHKSSCLLCLLAWYPLIDRFYKNLSIKGSEAQKQRPHEFLWTLWFDEKLYLLFLFCNFVSICLYCRKKY